MNIKIDRETAHATRDEIEFIYGLGNHSKHKFDKKVLLNRYIASMRLRKNWGSVDQKFVFDHVMKKVLK